MGFEIDAPAPARVPRFVAASHQAFAAQDAAARAAGLEWHAWALRELAAACAVPPERVAVVQARLPPASATAPSDTESLAPIALNMSISD